MAKVTHVKKAQQRYKTVPVLGEDGQPKRVPVMRKDGVTQKTTKTGRPITRRVTVEDKDQPLPNRHCDKCGVEIKVGDPYKHVTPKTSAYGGTKRVRCGTCPTWAPWELSQSLSARIQQAQNDATSGVEETDPQSVADALRAMAESVRDLAQEKEESAQNVEDGFGHPTEVSEELANTAEELNTWAEELDDAASEAESVEVQDEMVECGECDDGQVDCPACNGEGTVGGGEDGEDEDCPECDNGQIDCTSCDGAAEVENEEYEEMVNQLEEYLSKMDESPV